MSASGILLRSTSSVGREDYIAVSCVYSRLVQRGATAPISELKVVDIFPQENTCTYVFEKATSDIDNPLYKLENAVLTAYIAWYQKKQLVDLSTAVERAIELLQGKIPKTVVNPKVLNLLKSFPLFLGWLVMSR